MNIYNTIDGILNLPKFILEFAIIFSFIMIYEGYDGGNIFHSSLIDIMILYCLCLFGWRIILYLFDFYEAPEIAVPIYLMVFTMGLYVVILQFNPNYEIGRRKITVYNQEQVASNCDKARWIGTLYYSFNNGYLSSTKTWQVTGNTEEAKKRMQTNIDRFLMLNPTYTYDRQDIQLFWLPKRFVKENNYPNDWYKLTDPDTIYQPQ